MHKRKENTRTTTLQIEYKKGVLRVSHKTRCLLKSASFFHLNLVCWCKIKSSKLSLKMPTNIGSFFYIGNGNKNIILVVLVCPCGKKWPVIFLSLCHSSGAKMERSVVHLLDENCLYTRRFPPHPSRRFGGFSIWDQFSQSRKFKSEFPCEKLFLRHFYCRLH